MTYPNDNPNRRPADDGGLSMSVGIIAALAIALVVGLAFWTLNDSGRITALNTAPSELRDHNRDRAAGEVAGRFVRACSKAARSAIASAMRLSLPVTR